MDKKEEFKEKIKEKLQELKNSRHGKKALAAIALGATAFGATAGITANADIMAKAQEEFVNDNRPKVTEQLEGEQYDYLYQDDEELADSIFDETARKDAEQEYVNNVIDSLANSFAQAQAGNSQKAGETANFEQQIQQIEENIKNNPELSDEAREKALETITELKEAQKITQNTDTVDPEERVDENNKTLEENVEEIAQGQNGGEIVNAEDKETNKDKAIAYGILAAFGAALVATGTAIGVSAAKHRKLHRLATQAKLDSKDINDAEKLNKLAQGVVDAHKNNENEKKVKAAEEKFKKALANLKRSDGKLRYREIYLKKASRSATIKRAFHSSKPSLGLPTRNNYMNYTGTLLEISKKQNKGRPLSDRFVKKIENIKNKTLNPDAYYGVNHLVKAGEVELPLFPSEYVDCSSLDDKSKSEVQRVFDCVQNSLPYVGEDTYVKTITYTSNGKACQVRCAFGSEIGAELIKTALIKELPADATNIHVIHETRGAWKEKDSSPIDVSYSSKENALKYMQGQTSLLEIITHSPVAEKAPVAEMTPAPAPTLDNGFAAEPAPAPAPAKAEEIEKVYGKEAAEILNNLQKQIEQLQDSIEKLENRLISLETALKAKEATPVVTEITPPEATPKARVEEPEVKSEEPKVAETPAITSGSGLIHFTTVDEVKDFIKDPKNVEYLQNHPFIIHIEEDKKDCFTEYIKPIDRNSISDTNKEQLENPYYKPQRKGQPSLNSDNMFKQLLFIKDNSKRPMIIVDPVNKPIENFDNYYAFYVDSIPKDLPNNKINFKNYGREDFDLETIFDEKTGRTTEYISVNGKKQRAITTIMKGKTSKILEEVNWLYDKDGECYGYTETYYDENEKTDKIILVDTFDENEKITQSLEYIYENKTLVGYRKTIYNNKEQPSIIDDLDINNKIKSYMKFSYDDQGRVEFVDEYDSKNNQLASTKHIYETDKAKEASQHVRTSYNENKKVTKVETLAADMKTVTETKEYIYDAYTGKLNKIKTTDESGKLTETKEYIYDTYTGKLNKIKTTDESGKLTEQNFMESDGSVDHSVYYTYNDDGALSKVAKYEGLNDKLINTTKYIYDSSKKLQEKKTYISNGALIHARELQYDDKGEISGYIDTTYKSDGKTVMFINHLDKDEKTTQLDSYVYRNNKLITLHKRYYNTDGSVVNSTKLTYQNGLVKEAKLLDAEGKVISREEYVYKDKDGQKIKTKFYKGSAFTPTKVDSYLYKDGKISQIDHLDGKEKNLLSSEDYSYGEKETQIKKHVDNVHTGTYKISEIKGDSNGTITFTRQQCVEHPFIVHFIDGETVLEYLKPEDREKHKNESSKLYSAKRDEWLKEQFHVDEFIKRNAIHPAVVYDTGLGIKGLYYVYFNMLDMPKYKLQNVKYSHAIYNDYDMEKDPRIQEYIKAYKEVLELQSKLKESEATLQSLKSEPTDYTSKRKLGNKTYKLSAEMNNKKITNHINGLKTQLEAAQNNLNTLEKNLKRQEIAWAKKKLGVGVPKVKKAAPVVEAAPAPVVEAEAAPAPVVEAEAAIDVVTQYKDLQAQLNSKQTEIDKVTLNLNGLQSKLSEELGNEEELRNQIKTKTAEETKLKTEQKELENQLNALAASMTEEQPKETGLKNPVTATPKGPTSEETKE